MTAPARDALLAEWRRLYGEPPRWTETLTNDGLRWHLERAKMPVVDEGGEA